MRKARPRGVRAALRLKDGDRIAYIRAERAAGPGWQNAPLWIIVRESGGKLREECLQPNEQTRDMLLLYRAAEAIHAALAGAVEGALLNPSARKRRVA